MLAASLGHIYDALAPGGFLLLYEATDPMPAHLFGLDARTWNFNDEREFGLWIAKPRWRVLLAHAGLTMVSEHW